MSFTGWLRLQRQQRACTRSGPAGPGKHSILFRDVSAYRISLFGRQSLPREKASVSTAAEEGTEQRRSGVGGTSAQPRPPHPAQSPLCRRIRIWPKPYSQQPERRRLLYPVAARAVDAAQEYSPRLHLLGAI